MLTDGGHNNYIYNGYRTLILFYVPGIYLCTTKKNSAWEKLHSIYIYYICMGHFLLYRIKTNLYKFEESREFCKKKIIILFHMISYTHIMVDILKVSLVTRNNSFFHMTWKYFNISKNGMLVYYYSYNGLFFLGQYETVFYCMCIICVIYLLKNGCRFFHSMVRKKLCGL